MSRASVRHQNKKFAWLWAVIPLAILGGLIWLFFVTDPLKPLGVSAPPLESITVERTTLND